MRKTIFLLFILLSVAAIVAGCFGERSSEWGVPMTVVVTREVTRVVVVTVVAHPTQEATATPSPTPSLKPIETIDCVTLKLIAQEMEGMQPIYDGEINIIWLRIMSERLYYYGYDASVFDYSIQLLDNGERDKAAVVLLPVLQMMEGVAETCLRMID